MTGLLMLSALGAGTASAQVVISQVYGGGGNSGATYKQKYIELYNQGDTVVDLDGTSLQYAAAAGTNWSGSANLSGSIPANSYFLVQVGAGGNGVDIPVSADLTVNLSPAAANGNIALVDGTTSLTCQTTACQHDPMVLDLVGFGTGAAHEGTGPAPAPAATASIYRADGGCTDTDDNAADFTRVNAPDFAPRNTSSPVPDCGTGTEPVGAKVVISQSYGGGGNSGATYTHDFIEIFNSGDAPADLTNWTVQYASAAGSTWQTTELSGTLQPGQYYLIQQAAGNGGTTPLPTPDATGSIAMAGSNGKVALVSSTTALTGTCPTDPSIQDLLGISSTASCYEGAGPAPAISNTTAALRANAGCTDTDDNAADFTTEAPAPRNSASPLNPCAGAPEPTAPVVSFDSATVSVAEGNDPGAPNTLTFTVNYAPAIASGEDISFQITYSGDTDRYSCGGSACATTTVTLDENDASPYLIEVQTVPDTTPNGDATVTVTLSGFTGTDSNQPAEISTSGSIIDDDHPIYEIYEIQGTGLRSPFAPASGNGVGDLISTQSNVVTAIASNGFFIQTPDERAGTAPAEASTGVFVFTGAAPTGVVVGDLVDVSGQVQEYFDWTQITNSSFTVTGTGTLPTPVTLDETRPSPDPDNLSCPATQSNFECYENMLVEVAAGIAVTGNQTFGSDHFGEAYATASGLRARREKGLLPSVVSPVTGLPVWDGNPEVFELDADGAGAMPVDTQIFGGDMFEAVGVMSYQFGNYALRPTSITLVSSEQPRPVPAAENSDELRIGSLNVLNLCAPNCSPRMARVTEYIGVVLDLPDVIAIQEFGDVGSDLADLLNAEYNTSYVTHEGIANTVPPATPSPTAIRNAFLVNTARVSVDAVRDLDVTLTLDDCSGTPPCVLHDRPPQLLEATFNGEKFAVLNNHTRSLIGISDGPRVPSKRFAQAQSIAQLVQRFQQGLELEGANPAPTDTAGVPLILVGDYNAFEVTDGYADVVGLIAGTYDNAENQYTLPDDGEGGTANITVPPLRNLVLDVDEQDRYSYTFAEDLGEILGEAPRTVGSVQVLDHGLVNDAAQIWCPELVYGRGNADAPARHRNNGTGLIGSSDHDGFIVRLYTDRDGQCAPDPHIFSDGFED